MPYMDIITECIVISETRTRFRVGHIGLRKAKTPLSGHIGLRKTKTPRSGHIGPRKAKTLSANIGLRKSKTPLSGHIGLRKTPLSGALVFLSTIWPFWPFLVQYGHFGLS